MKFAQLSKKISDLIGMDNLRITADGPISCGFFPYDLETFEKDFRFDRLEIISQLEVMNPPLSLELKNELLSEVQLGREKLLARQDEIINLKNDTIDKMLKSKLSFCDELNNSLGDLSIVPNQKTKQDKIQIKLSLREFAIWLYGHTSLVFDTEQIKLLKFYSENYLYYNETKGEYCDINLYSLRKEYSQVKGNFASMSIKNSPIASTEEKVTQVLKKIQSTYV